MATELLKDLDQKVVRDNESWSRLRTAFSSCISQFGNGAYLASEYIGGQSVNRDFKGTEKARDPITPISGAKQREALKMLVDQILSDKAFQFSPALLRKLITESWQDGRYSSFGGMDYPIYRMILNLQEIVLDQCLDSERAPADPEPGAAERPRQQTRSRSPRSSARSPTASSPSSPRPADGPAPFAISTIRRNLQREYVKRLSNMVLGPKNDPYFGMSYRYIVFYGDIGLGPARRQEPGAAAPRGDRPEDRQDRRPEGRSRSTTRRWPTSRRSATGSTRS